MTPEQIAERIVSAYTNTLTHLDAFGAAEWSVMFKTDIAAALRQERLDVAEWCETQDGFHLNALTLAATHFRQLAGEKP